MPRVIAFVNGAIGAAALRLLGDALVGVVWHDDGQRRDEDALRAAAGGRPLFTASAIRSDPAPLAALAPTHGLSVFYGHIVKPPVMGLFPHGMANLHPSLLPHGRGTNPNAWALATGEPAGVTLHVIDDGVDTGPVLAQLPVAVLPTDDAKDLYQRLLATGERLLAEALPLWLAGKLTPVPQPAGAPARRKRDLDALLRIDPDATYTGRQLVDLLRARSFAPFLGAPYTVDGRRLRLRLVIEEEPS